MPHCVRCNAPLFCTCSKEPQPIGQTVIDCPLKAPGKMWIHVMDDAGDDLKGVMVKGPEEKATKSTGLAIFEPLKAGDYTAELVVPLASPIGENYDPPEAGSLKKPVTVWDGTLAYVHFILTRKSTLKVRFVYVSAPRTSMDPEPFKVCTVQVKAEGFGGEFERSTATGEIDIVVPAGSYDVTPDYTSVDATQFDFSKATRRDEELPPGGSCVVTFQLIRKAKLKVEIVYKRNSGKTDKKEFLASEVLDITADFAGNDFHPAGITTVPTDKGIADFTIVPAGKYRLKPDFSKLDECKWDYVDEWTNVELLPGDDQTIEIEVEPLYQTVQLLAHCLLTIPDRIYVPASNETMTPTNTTDPEKATYKVDGITNDSELKGEWKGKYHGLEDEQGDIDARVKFLKYTLEEAEKHADPDRTNLKVFMIPECYFQGLYGAYLFDNIGHLFQSLMTLTGDEKWRDWLFVFGTVNCVDTGISILDKEAGTKGGTGITQMMNYSPVIRGGLGGVGKGGGSETDPQFRLIQKLVNSAELLDDVEVIPHTGYDPSVRKIAVNQDVQFQGTQNEDKVAAILTSMFDKTDKGYDAEAETILCTRCKLPASQWTALVNAIQIDITALGIVRVVRSIRICNIDKTPDDLSEWSYAGFVDKANGHLTSNKTYLTAALPLLLGLLEGKWKQDFIDDPPPTGKAPGFDQKAWKSLIGTPRLNRILKAVEGSLVDAGIQLKYQETELLEKIRAVIAANDAVTAFFNTSILLPLMQRTWEEDYRVTPPEKARFAKAAPAPLAFSLENWNVLMDQAATTRIDRIHQAVRSGMATEAVTLTCNEKDLESELSQLLANRKQAIDFFDPKVTRAPDTYGFSIYPTWKKLLELYCKEKLIANVPLRQDPLGMDYRDYCFVAKRKAGPFITWQNAEGLDSCKKLTFGLEICADHASARLKNALSTGTKTAPKAVIDIQLVPSAGMTLAQQSIVARDGGYAFNCDGWNGKEVHRTEGEGTYLKVWFDAPECVFKNPVLPHSAQGKGGADLSRKTFTANRVALDNDKAKILFAKGAGELHVYGKQPLPK